MSRFSRKRELVRGMLILLAIFWSLPALAGGGGIAVVVDELPTGVLAGVPFEVGLTVRSAHEDATGIIEATPLLRFEHTAGSAAPVTAMAEPSGAVGHYVASITLPETGHWRWWIQPFGQDEPFRTTQPPLDVRARDAATSEGKPTTTEALEVQARDRNGLINFAPRTISIAAGSTVRWTNVGALPHTVTGVDGDFASGALLGGASYAHTFEQPGTYAYYCEYHGSPDGKGQYGTIVVTAPAQQAARGEAVNTNSVVTELAAPPAQAATPQQLPALGAETGVGIGLLVAVAAALVGVGLRRRIR